MHTKNGRLSTSSRDERRGDNERSEEDDADNNSKKERVDHPSILVMRPAMPIDNTLLSLSLHPKHEQHAAVQEDERK